MIIKDPLAAEADIPEEMTCFLVTEAFDALFFDQPIAAFEMVANAADPASKPHSAIARQEIARGDYVA